MTQPNVIQMSKEPSIADQIKDLQEKQKQLAGAVVGDLVAQLAATYKSLEQVIAAKDVVAPGIADLARQNLESIDALHKNVLSLHGR